MTTAQHNTGGPVAIRGFLVQTLVALLDIAHANPSFTEITLEPAIGNGQFDFLWKDGQGSHAVQVKSTENHFTESQVEEWVTKLEAARSNEQCRLILVGKVLASLDRKKNIRSVAIETKNLDLPGLSAEAAHKLASFLEAENQHSGTAAEREIIVGALINELQNLSITSETLSRQRFVAKLKDWIRSAPKSAPIRDTSRLSHCDRTQLVGRDGELDLLNNAWAKTQRHEPGRPHILSFIAIGGEGKTSLVSGWTADLAEQDWPGCETVFAWSFQNQGSREYRVTSSDLFLKEALIAFGGDRHFAASNADPREKGKLLASIVAAERSLLILDGLEPLQDAPNSLSPGKLKDQGIASLLEKLAEESRGLCIVTARIPVRNLNRFLQKTVHEVELMRLSPEHGARLLQKLGVTGSRDAFAELVEDVKGHALTLTLLGSFLRSAYAGDIDKRDLVKLEDADAEEGGNAFRVMDAYVRWLRSSSTSKGTRGRQKLSREKQRAGQMLAFLRLMGLFDRPVTANNLEALLKEPGIPGLTKPIVGLTVAQQNLIFHRLEKAKLITVNREKGSPRLLSLDAHRLLREYFAKHVSKTSRPAWREAHQRLYVHLSATTPDQPQPTLEDLQPLYHAIAHGCQAGLHEEVLTKVYCNRIQRGSEFYSTLKLGAFGADLAAIVNFFESSRTQVSSALSEASQASVLGIAAFSLRAMGRLSEALAAYREGLTLNERHHNWKQAALAAGGLTETELLLGEVNNAIAEGEKILKLADRSDEWGDHQAYRASYAHALHQANQTKSALIRFKEVERMQSQRRAGRRLYSACGLWYCDLLLTEAERAAWELTLKGPDKPPEKICYRKLLTSCRSVHRRAQHTLKQVQAHSNAPLLNEALDHITLARTALFVAILDPRPSNPSRPYSELNTAVSRLRQASMQEYTVGALISRAWLGYLVGKCISFCQSDVESARRDLDEAKDIAERGPMKLFLADIYLHRARLFFREKPYPWKGSPQNDLKEAEQLIRECGYYRREQELEAAKRFVFASQEIQT